MILFKINYLILLYFILFFIQILYEDSCIKVNCCVPKYLKYQLEKYYSNLDEENELNEYEFDDDVDSDFQNLSKNAREGKNHMVITILRNINLF